MSQNSGYVLNQNLCELLLSMLSPNQAPAHFWPAALLLTSCQNLSTRSSCCAGQGSWRRLPAWAGEQKSRAGHPFNSHWPIWTQISRSSYESYESWLILLCPYIKTLSLGGYLDNWTWPKYPNVHQNRWYLDLSLTMVQRAGQLVKYCCRWYS